MPVYFNEKTKKYYCKFYYKDWQGIRRQKKKEGFSLVRDAKAYEQDFLNKAAGSCDMKFSALVDYYLADYKTRRRATSYENRYYIATKQFIPIFGEMPINKITPVIIRKWQNTIIDAGYSEAYQRNLSTYLSTLFNFAVKYYNLKENPVRIAGTIGKKYAGNIDFWTVEEFNRFKAALVTETEFSKRYIHRVTNTETLLFAFNTLFYTGCRVGELLALTVGDYDPTAQTLNIDKTLAIVGGKPIIQPPKTAKSKRIISLPTKLCTMFDNYIASMYEPQKNERLFPMLNKYSLTKALKSTAKLAGIKVIRIHDLRHSHASMVINFNYSPLALAERLGHEDVQTTLNIYAHLYPNKSNELAEKINSLM